jgi:hypothetical protein
MVLWASGYSENSHTLCSLDKTCFGETRIKTLRRGERVKKGPKTGKREALRIITQYFLNPEPSEHTLHEGGISHRSSANLEYFIQIQRTYQQLNVDDVVSRFDGVQVIHPQEEGHFSC